MVTRRKVLSLIIGAAGIPLLLAARGDATAGCVPKPPVGDVLALFQRDFKSVTLKNFSSLGDLIIQIIYGTTVYPFEGDVGLIIHHNGQYYGAGDAKSIVLQPGDQVTVFRKFGGLNTDITEITTLVN